MPFLPFASARALRGAALIAAIFLMPSPGLACACGCGVFDIGNLFPDQPGGAVWLEYDFMNQGMNWHGPARAPAKDNADKGIRTHFETMGAQYLFKSGLGVMVELPLWERHFATVDGGVLHRFEHAALGDLRIDLAYAGFSEDRNTGVTFGVKLPTGDFRYAHFDRDTEIGSGSTDLMFGAYHFGELDAFGTWRYFLNARLTTAIAEQGGYRPGDELNGLAGLSYDVGSFLGVEIAPMVQVIASLRRRDSGPAANPANSGYSRVLIGPGIDMTFGHWIVHGEVDVPVYQNMIGEQLAAPVLLKSNLSFNF